MTRHTGREESLLDTVLMLLILIALLKSCGCGASDHETKQILRESLDRQAEQNQAMARQSQEVAEASKRLVEADAQARQEIVGVHRDLQAERAGLDEQQNQLEDDRRTLAAQRHRDPLIANTLLTVALITAALLPLLVAYWLLVRTQETSPDDAQLAEVLIGEMTSDTPLLLCVDPPPEPALPGPEQEGGPRRLPVSDRPADPNV